MNIRKKDNYSGLVKSENNRRFKIFSSFIFKIGFSCFLVCVISTIILNFIGDFLTDILSIDSYDIALLFLLISVLGVIVYILMRKKEDDSLNKFYSYLPIDEIDIKNNNLTSWKSYILCVNSLSNDIFSNDFKRFGYISERVRFDILEIMTKEYNISTDIRNILNENFESFIFHCDSEEKIEQLMNYYLYKLNGKKLEDDYKIILGID